MVQLQAWGVNGGAALMENHRGGNCGSLGLQWENNLEVKSWKNLSLHGRKEHFTEWRKGTYTWAWNKILPIWKHSSKSAHQHIFHTSLPTCNCSLLMFLMGKHFFILCRTFSATKYCCDMCSLNANLLAKCRGFFLPLCFKNGNFYARPCEQHNMAV